MESSSLSLSSCSKENMELIQQAILQLMEEEENRRTSSSFVAVNEDDDDDDDDDDDLKEEDRRRRLQVLTRLLSQLDTLGGDEKIQQPKSSFDAKKKKKKKASYAVNEVGPTGENLNKVEVGNCEIGNEEIAQELSKVKRQNFITHCLLTLMIILTVGWQLSEVSLILMVKNGMSHPFRSLGSIFKGMLKGPPKMMTMKKVVQDGGEKMSSTKEKLISASASSLPGLKIPELSLPTFDFSNDGED